MREVVEGQADGGADVGMWWRLRFGVFYTLVKKDGPNGGVNGPLLGLFLFTGPAQAGPHDGLEWRPMPGTPHRAVPARARRPPFRAGLGPGQKKDFRASYQAASCIDSIT